MNESSFTKAVLAMALPPDMQEHLVQLAPNLTDKERTGAAEQLAPLTAHIAKNREQALAVVGEGQKATDTLRAQNLSTVRKSLEDEQRTNDAAAAESSLSL